MDEPLDSDESFQNLDDSELYALLQDIQQSNLMLEAENQMFERVLTRSEQRVEQNDNIPASTTTHEPMRSKRRFSTNASDKTFNLSIEQKCEMANQEIQEMTADIRKHKEETDKFIANCERAENSGIEPEIPDRMICENFTSLELIVQEFLQYRQTDAIIEEADICISDTQKEFCEFQREIVKDAFNFLTKAVNAERCIKYFQKKLKYKEVLIEKVQLKSATLKMQEKKVINQLKMKEKMGEVLHEVDYKQLQILNCQYFQILHERSQDLLRMKVTAGISTQGLNVFKKRHLALSKEANQIKGEIDFRKDIHKRIEGEIQMIETERAHVERINKKLRKNVSTFEAPKILEYVMEKNDLCHILLKTRIWERKITMAEEQYRISKKMWFKLKEAMESQSYGSQGARSFTIIQETSECGSDLPSEGRL